MKYPTIRLIDGLKVFRDADSVPCIVLDPMNLPTFLPMDRTWDIGEDTHITGLLEYLAYKHHSTAIVEPTEVIPMSQLRDYALCDECLTLLRPDDEAYEETSTGMSLCDTHSRQSDDGSTIVRVSDDSTNLAALYERVQPIINAWLGSTSAVAKSSFEYHWPELADAIKALVKYDKEKRNAK